MTLEVLHPRMILGNANEMDVLRDDEADLVITGPPYFSEELFKELEKPRNKQRYSDALRDRILAFADSFGSQWSEIGRILAPNGTLVLQAKNIVYGGFEIRLADCYVGLIESTGLRLATTIWWQSSFKHPSRRQASNVPSVGGYRAPNAEQFLVFQYAEHEPHHDLADISDDTQTLLSTPFWITPGEGGRARHMFQAPQSVIRVFIELYSKPGDLIVDPFAGSGETLRTAYKLNRHAIGYEIESSCVEKFKEYIVRVIR